MSSLFGKLFGAPPPKPRQDPTAATAVAIQRIQTAKDMLEKKSLFLEKKIMQELVEAKKCGTKNKQKAILHLKRKARYLKQQQAIQGQCETLDSQIGALEMAATTNEVVDALATGKAAMDANYKDVDKVHDLIDDVNEQMQAINETTDALSTPIGDRVDEDELLKELEDLEQEDLDAKLSEVTPTSVELPSVPTTAMPDAAQKVPAAKKQEKDELDELSAWAL